ncbi:MAG TPA: DUF1275 family protein [Tepidisphaeraceae bacterium]|jgi:uncharacterized membrane protein YoaK (UPF0700 family)
MLSAAAYSFRKKSRLAISLSWIAGYTNVIVFLVLGHIVISHMTGNVTQLGLAIAQILERMPHARNELFFFGYIVGAFFTGAAVSAILTETARRRGAVSKYALPIALETILLGGLCIGVWLLQSGHISVDNPFNFYWMSGAAAAAMGLQNATITRISGAVIRTTHLTGVTTDLAIESVQYLAWAMDRSYRKKNNARVLIEPNRLGRIWKASRRHPSFQRLILLMSVFGSFLFGAVTGPLIYFHFPKIALGVPVVFLLWIIFLDWRKPVADVREIDLTTDPMLGSAGLIKEMLPPEVGVYRLVHHRHDRIHSAPDFQAWLARLPKRWRVIVVAVSPLTHFDIDNAIDLAEAIRKLHAQNRCLVLVGITTSQYKILSRGGVIDILGSPNMATDLKLGLQRAYKVLEKLTK